MKPLRITNIQRGCVYDGPGVRTTVFLKGCTLKCPWCCNPETISQNEEWFIDDTKCLFIKGMFSEICEMCERKAGKRPISACPFSVAEPTSTDYSTEELFEYLLRDEYLYRHSFGGVTFSGGEPLLQAETLTPLLERLKEKNINITFETTLVAPTSHLRRIKEFVNLFIVDVKLQPQMYLENSGYIGDMINRLNIIRDIKTIFRMVFIDDVLAKRKKVTDSLLKLGVSELELLICHNLGEGKYNRLSIKNVDYTSDKNNAELFSSFLSKNGIKSTILSI